MKSKVFRNVLYSVVGFILIGFLAGATTIIRDDYIYSTGNLNFNLTNGTVNAQFYPDLQTALDSAGVGGKVRIPCGTYTINSPLTWYDNQIIEGDNLYCVVISAGSSWNGYSMMQSSTPTTETNVIVRGMTFDGNSRVQIGLFLNFTKLSLFERIQIREVNMTDFYLDQDNYYTEVRDSITNFDAIKNNTGVTNMDNEVTFRNIRIANSVGINITGGDQIHLDGIRIDGSSVQTGVVIDDAHGVLITGTRIETSVQPVFCINITSTSREVIMIGGLLSGCTRQVFDESGELTLISVGGVNNDMFSGGKVNISDSGITTLTNLTVNGLSVFNNHINFSTSDLFNIYNVRNITTSVSSNSNFVLGTNSREWAFLDSTGNTILAVNGTYTRLVKDLMPSGDSARNLGTDKLRWNNISTVNIQSNNMTVYLNMSIKGLSGAGNDFLCIDSDGNLFRRPTTCDF